MGIGQRFICEMFKSAKTRRQVSPEPEEDSEEAGFPNLRQILGNGRAASLFEEFCRGERSQENVEFWRRVERYRRIGGARRRRVEARTIYGRFVSPDATCDLNLLPGTRAAIARGITAGGSDLFDSAQTEIYSLMDEDTFQRFKDSALAAHIRLPPRKRKSGPAGKARDGWIA